MYFPQMLFPSVYYTFFPNKYRIKNVEKGEFLTRPKGFRSMIASSQFSNLQLGNLATWQLGNLAI